MKGEILREKRIQWFLAALLIGISLGFAEKRIVLINQDAQLRADMDKEAASLPIDIHFLQAPNTSLYDWRAETGGKIIAIDNATISLISAANNSEVSIYLSDSTRFIDQRDNIQDPPHITLQDIKTGDNASVLFKIKDGRPTADLVTLVPPPINAK